MASTSWFGIFCLKWQFSGTNFHKILQVGKNVWPLLIICMHTFAEVCNLHTDRSALLLCKLCQT